MDSNTNPNSTSSQPNPPSLVGGHAEYIKGAVQSTIGSLTSSPAWTTSGEQAKAHAVHDLKVAGAQRDPQTKGFGKVEETAGRWTGCEGMRTEGELSAKKD